MRALVLRRLTFVAAVFTITLLTGTIGFVTLERYTPFEAFYFTLFTITTVGYSELHTLSNTGRAFNSLIIFFGVSGHLLAVGVITQTAVELEFGNYFRKRRIKKVIDGMRNHFIVCGYGRVGRSAAAELTATGTPFIVIDNNDARVEWAMKAGLTAVCADCTRDETLRAVGIDRAIGMIAALKTDADNLFVILSAKSLNPGLRLATRVSDEESEQKMRRAGADVVFAPYMITGQRMAQSMLRPHVHEFLDFTTKSMGMDVRIEQIQVVEGCELASKSLQETQIRRDLGVIVLAIRKASGQMLFNPPPEASIESGDHLIAMGPPEMLTRLEKLAEAGR